MDFCYNIEYLLLTLLSYSRLTETVVPEYCMQPLNKSDCGLKPTAVISYWKPGSRCDVEFWRGCPTWNKFDNEYECSLVCIFQMKTFIEENLDECKGIFNGNKCNKTEIDVYTFKNGECIKATWKGCSTLNKFNTEADCINACAGDAWQNNLKDMKLQQLKLIIDVLDSISQIETVSNVTLQAEGTVTESVLTESSSTDDVTIEATTSVTSLEVAETTIENDKTASENTQPATEISTAQQTATAVISTSTVAIQTTTEALTTDTEAIRTTTEAVTTSTEAIKTTTEVLTTNTEAIQTTTEALATSTEAIPTTTEVITTNTEVIQTTTEAPATSTEAIQKTTGIITTTTESIQTTTETFITTTETLDPEDIDDVVSARKRLDIKKIHE